MKAIIDRFEGDFAVCEMEDKSMVNIERRKIPTNAKEGDILVIESDTITIDFDETEIKKNKFNKLMEDLWK